MKTTIPLLLLSLALAFAACGKPQSDAERQAEIDRQVQQRLDAEHQADTQRNLDQRQSALDAREQALTDQENQPTATPARVAATGTPVRPSNAQPNDADDDSYSTFYRKLDPYGDWIETSTYGYVFQPRVASRDANWRPYTDGHWVYTDAGWTWISAEPFGWATCHYGRWTHLRGAGWVWVPGNEWAPAWVSWRRGNDFVGWAPLPPEARFDRQSGLRDFSDDRYRIAPEQYAFVPVKEFGGPQSARVIVPPARNVTIITQTKNVTNITYNNHSVVDRGPSYDDLRGRSEHQIPKLRIERASNANAEKPVIRGDVVSLPTRDFRPAQKAARPPRVQRRIEQPEKTTPVPTTPTPVPTTPTPVPTTPTSVPTATPEPTLNPRQQARREHMIEQRKARRQQPPVNTPAPSPTAEISATPTTTGTPALPPHRGRRPGPRPNQP